VASWLLRDKGGVNLGTELYVFGLLKSLIRRCRLEKSNASLRLGSDTFTKGRFGDAARYRSTGRIRGEVRRLLAGQLAEIDGLVRELLNLTLGES